jgi:phosphoglycerate kinase
VLDGFAVAHRAAASVSGISAYLPSYAGLLLEQEVSALQHVMQQPRRPLMLVLGGAKVESKIPILKSFVERADAILLGGAIMTVYLAAKGFSVGGSKTDPVLGQELLSILEKGTFIMAVDAIVGDPEGKNTRVVSFDKSFSMTNSEEIIYDIGPKTRTLFGQLLNKAKTIVWNGALGKFEQPAYRNGTASLVKKIAQRGDKGAYVVAGGGETVEMIRSLHANKSFSLVSTGGGAMLEFLSGEKLPGIQALEFSALNDTACL